MNVFFYGLFMERSLLESKGIESTNACVGFVDDYSLRIGQRATLVPSAGARAYGVTMTITPAEAAQLYGEGSVTDYLPEPVEVELMDGRRIEATCYNLPGDRVAGTNQEYAEALLKLASELSLPDSYLDEIRRAGS